MPGGPSPDCVPDPGCSALQSNAPTGRRRRQAVLTSKVTGGVPNSQVLKIVGNCDKENIVVDDKISQCIKRTGTAFEQKCNSQKQDSHPKNIIFQIY